MLTRRVATWLVPAPDSAVAEDVRRGKSAWTDSVHLLWSAWVFITPAFNAGGEFGYTWRWVIITLFSYPLFLLLFAKTQLAPRSTSYRYALGMAVLSMVFLRWYPSGVSYFIYACVMLRACNMRFRLYVVQLVLMNAVFVAFAWRIGYPPQLLLSIPAMTFTIGIVINVEAMNQEKDAALRMSHDEVRRLAATAERERIGRDLHDLLGHTLSLITLKLELSRKLFDRDTEAARREVEEAEKVARHALAEVRSAVTGIRATDLAGELAAARLMLESSAVHLDYGTLPSVLPMDIERALALVLREAVTNISRHAHASRASVELACDNDTVRLCISDNGQGGIGGDGNGLGGMRERVRALGGTLMIESARSRGTRVRVQVPLPRASGFIAMPAPSGNELPTTHATSRGSA